MIYLDTNIIVRIIAGDSPEQAVAAARLVENCRDDLYLPPAVFIEAAFVLLKIYRMPRADVATSLASFVALLTAEPNERARMTAAAAIFAARNVDMVDAWLAAETMALGHRVASFDADFRKIGVDIVDLMAN